MSDRLLSWSKGRPLVLGVLGLVIMAAVWELYKALEPEDGVVVAGVRVLPRTSDRAMPHVWEMITRLFQPAVGSSGPPLGKSFKPITVQLNEGGA